MAIIVLAGKSGSGKDTICNALIEASKEGSIVHTEKIVSATTRPPREGEQDGREYHFLSNEEFEAKIKSGEIFEYREYESSGGKVYYGSEKINLFEKDRRGDYVTILDYEGAKAYQEAYGKENVFVIEVDAPENVRMQRVIGREADDVKAAKEWVKRSEKDKRDFNVFTRNGIVNYRINNDSKEFLENPEGYLNDVICDITDALDEYESTGRKILKEDPSAWVVIENDSDWTTGTIVYNAHKEKTDSIKSMANDYAHLYMSVVQPEDYAVYMKLTPEDDAPYVIKGSGADYSEDEEYEIAQRIETDLDEVADTFTNHLITQEDEEEKAFLEDILINSDYDSAEYTYSKLLINNMAVYKEIQNNKDNGRVLDIDERDLYRRASEVADRVTKWIQKASNEFVAEKLPQKPNDISDKESVYERIVDRQFKKETEYIEQIVELLSELKDAELTPSQKEIIEEGKLLVKDLCKIDMELALLDSKHQRNQKDIEKENQPKKKQNESLCLE